MIRGIGIRVVLDLFSNCKRLVQVITPRGPSHGKQKNDDKGRTHH